MYIRHKTGTAISRSLAFVAIFLCLAMSSLMAGAAERAMIVLDGSGSMWGQINGVPKLTIARDTLREVLQGVPETTELGLISYGHREAGNCQDIELIVPVALGTSSRIADEVDALNFLGKTPLTDAVQMAAEELSYIEDKATVILITDGIETCEADPCALANLLESQGIDFTAHVVGFGLSEEEGRQVSCLAENTGGQYFSANDGESLVAALNEVVVAVPAQETTLLAQDQNGVLVDDVSLDWEVRDASGTVVAQASNVGLGVANDFGNGDYAVLVSGDSVAGGMEFSIEGDEGEQTIFVPVERVVLSATLEAPDEVAAGAEFEVVWTGPDDQSDFVTIVELGTREGGFGNYAYTRHGGPAEVTALDGIGVYELRYVHGPSDKTLATREITIVAVMASLEAPDSVGAGADFEVIWEGPDNDRDFITIVAVGADEGSFLNYGYTRHGSPAELKAPEETGSYEIRYVLNESDRTLASIGIEVTDVSATLDAPATVAAGAEFEVVWTGPDNQNDYVSIAVVGSDEGEYVTYEYSRRGSPVELKAPEEVGSYEIRYVMSQSRNTLASVAIEVTAVTATLSAPESVAVGAEFEVEWTGPNNANDYIAIAEVGSDEGDYLNYDYTRRLSPGELRAPDAIGTYELRYVMGQSKRTLATAIIETVATSASVEVTNNPVPGGVVKVAWTGPDYSNDLIVIVEAGAPEGEWADYAYTRHGSPAEIDVPRALGAFEIRYVLAQSKRTLARVPVTLSAASAELTAPASVAAGGVVDVTWSGPGNREDFIEIVPAGAAADEDAVTEARTSQGSPLQLFAPGSAGSYEVRYKMRDTGEVLATSAITVE